MLINYNSSLFIKKMQFFQVSSLLPLMCAPKQSTPQSGQTREEPYQNARTCGKNLLFWPLKYKFGNTDQRRPWRQWLLPFRTMARLRKLRNCKSRPHSWSRCWGQLAFRCSRISVMDTYWQCEGKGEEGKHFGRLIIRLTLTLRDSSGNVLIWGFSFGA